MELSNLSNYAAVVTTIIEILIAVALNCTAMLVLTRKRKKRVSDLSVLHLLVTEFLLLVWSICFYTSSVFVNNDTLSIANEIITMTCVISGYLQLIWITMDRILAVILQLRYRILVKKVILLPLFLFIWFISSIHGYFVGNANNPGQTFMCDFIWDMVLIATFLASYTYIILTLRGRS